MAIRYSKRFDGQFIELRAWLESKRLGAGDRFRQEVARSLSLAHAFPFMYAEYEGEVRQILVERFHQHIYYVVSPPDIEVIELLDARRAPKGWEEE